MENSIKRDIHLLESYAGMTHKMNDNQGRPKLDQAIEHILLDYKRVLKENEELRKKINEENKRCMMLAVEKQDYFEKYKYHLQQNESLTKEFSNCIPVQKVKDKIEYLEDYIEENSDEQGYWGNINPDVIYGQIEILQELLESEE